MVNDVNRKKRLAFAKKYKDWSIDQWKKVLWSDETMYTLRSKLPRKNWRLKNEKYLPECMMGTIKQDRRIKIWSCFSYNGVGEFYCIKDKLDADKYHYILQYKIIS